MKYSNLEIYKKLKYIDECFSWKWRRVIDEIANSTYKKDNIWLNNYLTENKYIEEYITISWIKIHRISPYWLDFLKKWYIQCFIEDYKWSINTIILILITIITWIIIYYITNQK